MSLLASCFLSPAQERGQVIILALRPRPQSPNRSSLCTMLLRHIEPRRSPKSLRTPVPTLAAVAGWKKLRAASCHLRRVTRAAGRPSFASFLSYGRARGNHRPVCDVAPYARPRHGSSPKGTPPCRPLLRFPSYGSAGPQPARQHSWTPSPPKFLAVFILTRGHHSSRNSPKTPPNCGRTSIETRKAAHSRIHPAENAGSQNGRTESQ